MVHFFHKRILTKAEQKKKDIADYKQGFDTGFDNGKSDSNWLVLHQDGDKWIAPENPYDKGYIDGAKKGLRIFHAEQKKFQRTLGHIARLAKSKK